MMKRILVLLMVVALMMVMLVGGLASAAFGANPNINAFGCIQREGFFLVHPPTSATAKYDRNSDTYICGYQNQNGNTHFTDNHFVVE